MSLTMQQLLYPYLAPAGDAGGGAGKPDFGDDHVPTDDDAAPPAKKAEPVVDTTDPEKKEAKGEGEEEEDDGGKDELTDEDRKKTKYVPRDRLNDVTRKSKAKEEAYQAEIAQLRQALDANKVDATIEQLDAKIAELGDKYDDHMMEGEKEKAKATRAELRKMETARQQMVSHAYSVQAQLAAIEQYRYDNALDALEQQYPVLNEQADDYEPDKTQEVADLMAYLQQSKGLSKADALRKAATTLLGPPPESKKEPEGNALKAQRTEEARKKALKTVNAQPADISKVGLDSDKLGGGGKITGKDLLKMDHDKFVTVDEETLKSLRGDDFVGEAA